MVRRAGGGSVGGGAGGGGGAGSDDGELDALSPQQQAIEDLKTRLAQIGGGDGTVYLDVLGEEGRQRRGDIPLDEFLESDGNVVGKRYGGGEYVASVRLGDGTWLKKKMPLRYSVMSYGPQKVTYTGPAPASSPAPAAPASAESGTVLAEMRAANQRLLGLLEKQLERPGATAPAGALPLTLADVENAIQRALSVSRPGVGLDPVDAWERARELVDRIRGSESDEDAMAIAVREGFKLVGRIMDGDFKEPGGGKGPGSNGHGAPPKAGGGKVNFMGMAYRHYLGELVKACKAGHTPEVTAEAFWKQLPADLVPTIHEVLSREDWLAYLGGYVPEVLTHQEWFGSLRDLLLAAYEEPVGK